MRGFVRMASSVVNAAQTETGMAHRPNHGTPWLTPDEVRSFLRSAGMDSSRKINEVLDGYDFSNKPLYFEMLQEGQLLYQFIRNASVEAGVPRAGNWFCGLGATQRELAIFGGGSGRRRHRFEVAHPFTALVGQAKPQALHWGWAGGGPGGATQIFVPPNYVGHLVAHGPDE
jgi:hypothetical protein